ncbi:MAG: phospholipid carrier-dependent glycosyltransferase [Parcubacteria group bacterium]|jgi:4-amino-4-deoxy-L-arabinose transferase-like glycosyltransferase
METKTEEAKMKETEPKETEKKRAEIKKDKSSWFLALLIIPLVLYFNFGLRHLTQFETADEHLWISDLYTGRIQSYWNAMASENWKGTRINDKPGITLAYVAGIGTWFENNVQDKIVKKANLTITYNPEKTTETFYIYRKPQVVFTGLMGIFFCLALWRLTRKVWLALAGASLVLLSPILIGISQIINPDAMLWIFSSASLLSFFVFLKETRFIDAFLAAFFLGLSLLSKYVALIFFPFFLVMLLAYLLFYYTELIEQKTLLRKTIEITLGYIFIIAGSIGLFALGMPAAIVNTSIIYKSIFEFGGMQNILLICAGVNLVLFLDAALLKSFIAKFLLKYLQFLKIVLPKILYLAMLVLAAATIANWSFMNNFLHTPILEVGGGKRPIILTFPFYQQMVLQAKPLFFSITPIALFLIFFLWAKSIFRRSSFDYIVFILSLFFLVFFYTVTQQALLVNVRYSVVLYPFALTLAAIGFYEIIKNLKHYYSLALFLLLLGASYLSVSKIQPFYFNYSNDLLPKNSIITTAWGYGGYEAINYIKSQGDPKNMKIWANYYGACPFFAGKCAVEGSTKWMKESEILNIDYVILSQDGLSKNKKGLQAINEIFPTDNPVWELVIDGRPDNFVKVYKNPLKQTTYENN